ncbi:MAG: phosphatidylglycerophosphatase A [Silicimonas sp.]|nr:phosphatidylglycerophosphatase A [Silicimonas sp.]
MRGLFLSFFGAGWLRPAPGTWGSLAALPAAYLAYLAGGPILLTLGAAALYFAGIAATRAETATGDDHDPSWIVIDEVVGQWIALLPVAIGASHVGLSPLRLWPGIVAAFLLFRLFDIWKPWLVGRADRRGDAVGVMLDDVWAGIFAAVTGAALAAFSHLVLM